MHLVRRGLFIGSIATAVGSLFLLEDKVLPRRHLRALETFGRISWRYKEFEWAHAHLFTADRKLYEEKLKGVHAACAQLALELCRRNGGIFIKAGQHAATLKPGKNFGCLGS